MRYSVLKAGTAPRGTRERLGDYGELFIDLLAEPGQDWAVHDVEHGSFPEQPEAWAAFVVTGSPASTYDDTPWVRELERFLRGALARGTPVLGICFGAQMVAQALGGRVGPNPAGWELGVVDVTLTEAGRAFPGLSDAPQPLRLLQTHADIVTELPPGAVHLGQSPRTPYEIFHVGPRALCLQGHPEMDRETVRELVEKRMARGLLGPDVGEPALASLSAEPHRPFLQDWLRRFLREGRLQGAA